MNEGELLTTAEAAEQSDYSRGYICRLCREGKIKAKKCGEGRNAPWLIDRQDLYRYADEAGRLPRPIADMLVDYANHI